jgi:hypothetical protein
MLRLRFFVSAVVTTINFVQPTVHLCSVHKPFEMIRFEINDVLNLS